MKGAAILVLVIAALTANASSAATTASACPTSNPPNEIVFAGGSGQTAQLGKSFGTPFQVVLANTNGCPLTGNLAGININFDAPRSGASGIFSSTGSNQALAGTDAQGVATAPSFVANDSVGSYTVDAESDYDSVEFRVDNTAAGVATAIAATGTIAQEATVNSQYGQPLEALITDANGNPVQGATASFTVVPGATGAGGSFLGGAATATTNSSGVAVSPPLLANGTSGKFTAAASTDGVSSVATFTLDNHADPMTLAVVGTTRTTARVETSYPPLSVTVRDSSGQPVEGAAVNFTVTAATGGAGASFVGGSTQETVTSDAGGKATSPPLVANKTAGSFTAVAAAGAEALPYTLTNVAGAPATVIAGAAASESAFIRTRFSVPLAVTVSDKDGNPVASATVIFTAPAHGASAHFRKRSLKIRVRTNKNGVAVAPALTANRKVGGYVVIARVEGTLHRAAFALVNEARE